MIDQAAPNTYKLPTLLLAAMVFLGAFLSFSMEPLVGRILVPLFGGAIHVWLTCIMFFQAMLLIGYAYTHLLFKKLGAWHFVILLLPLINIPFVINLDPSFSHYPLLALIVLFLVHFALPFAVLSSTATVAQAWFASSRMSKFGEPYALYAASNAGSLIGLLSYPLVIEPLVGLRVQSTAWAIGFGLYVALTACVWLTVRPHSGAASAPAREFSPGQDSRPSCREYAIWLLLSGLPSAFLLAVTNMVALEIGSFSLVWIAPLALYLGSFVLTFKSKSIVTSRALRHSWAEVVVFGVLMYLLPLSHWGFILGHLIVLAAICLLAHRELYERRPHVKYLTHFYLTIAIGGWLGGIMVSIISPLAFSGLYEYPLVLIALGISFWKLHFTAFNRFWRHAHILTAGSRLLVISLMLLVSAFGVITYLSYDEQFRHRNFYGIYKILDTQISQDNPERLRKLVHGSTLHGSQILDPSQQHIPTSYYYSAGNIENAFSIISSPRRIAVIGLGSGTTAVYGRYGDSITYYEIDRDNEKIARDWFTYLGNSLANIKIIVGDGRLNLQKKFSEEKAYELILVDAFTGDGIPTHLLTVEAMKVYLERMTANGVIVFHISNRYYDLAPIIKSTSAQLNLRGILSPPIVSKGPNEWSISSRCIIIARSQEMLTPLLDRGWIAFNEVDGLRETTPWTDDYINMLDALIF
jgi:spermidine synthase